MAWSSTRTISANSTEEQWFAFGANVVRVFYDGSNVIKYAWSGNETTSFSTAVIVDSTSGNNDVMLNSNICYDTVTGRLHFLYGRNIDIGANAILCHRYTDNPFSATPTFSAEHIIDNGSSHGTNRFYRVGMTAFNNNVALHYASLNNGTFTTDGLWRALSSNGGATWATPIKAYPGTVALAGEPNACAQADGSIFLTWYDRGVNVNGSGDLWISISRDGGVTWPSSATKLTTTNDFGRPRPACSNGKVWIVANKPWASGSPVSDVYTLSSTDNGVSFGAPVLRASHTSGDLDHPDVIVVGNFVGMVWMDQGFNPAPRNFIFSTDGGATFSSPVNTLTASTGSISDAPRLLATTNNIISTGYDNTNNNILYAVNPFFVSGPKTYNVSKEVGASDSNAGTAASPFLTIAKAQSVAVGGDTILFRSGDTWIENFVVPASKSGTSGQHTTYGVYGLAGNGKAKIQAVNPSAQACLLLFPGPVNYVDFNDLELTNNNFNNAGNAANAISGEHIVESPTGGGASSFVNFKRCYLHHSANTAVQSYNGPTPRSSSGNGSGSGDDSDWSFIDCEIYATGNSAMIFHGSRLNLLRTHIHRWGESSDSLGKHGIYHHSPGGVVDSCNFHNDEAQVAANSGPQQGQPISQRTTGITVVNNILHDCNGFVFFTYDNVRGTSLYFGNRCYNLYNWGFFMDAGNDTAPPYTFGPNPMDKFVFANNVFHFQGSPINVFDLSASSGNAQYLGGLVIANNVVIGNYTNAINNPNSFAANNSVTGALLEKNNLWNATGSGTAGTFRWAATNRTLAQWQAQTITGNLQGVGSFYNTNPNLGLAPAGDLRRAPKPYQILGVVQTQTDNTLISSTSGAPDYFPQTGSPVIDAGTNTVDASITYTAG